MISESVHDSVLLQEVIRVLDLHSGDIFLDATLGGAGHTLAAAEHIGPDGWLIGIDHDESAIARAQEALARTLPRKDLIRANFRDIDTVLNTIGADHIDKAVFDLGYSSDQLELSGRGFSFQRNEPLLMTLSNTPDESTLTAYDIVNSFEEETIADMLYGYGEERYARRIASAIVRARKERPIETTGELVEIIRHAVPGQYTRTRIHFATRTFQALRIAVNDELGALQEGLEKTFSHLSPGGRLAVISFHSLEDRIVKRFMKGKAHESENIVLTKKPITPASEETSRNPRARSAKLRAIQRN